MSPRRFYSLLDESSVLECVRTVRGANTVVGLVSRMGCGPALRDMCHSGRARVVIDVWKPGRLGVASSVGAAVLRWAEKRSHCRDLRVVPACGRLGHGGEPMPFVPLSVVRAEMSSERPTGKLRARAPCGRRPRVCCAGSVPER